MFSDNRKRYDNIHVYPKIKYMMWYKTLIESFHDDICYSAEALEFLEWEQEKNEQITKPAKMVDDVIVNIGHKSLFWSVVSTPKTPTNSHEIQTGASPLQLDPTSLPQQNLHFPAQHMWILNLKTLPLQQSQNFLLTSSSQPNTTWKAINQRHRWLLPMQKR